MTARKPILGGDLRIDLPRLVATRLLLQANSGGGKSWALRRILEQTHGLVQHIVLDVEDEFFTLREKFDYVLAGREGGDCPADVRSAPLLARRLLELNVSAIIGLYELKAQERVRFVRLFLESLISAPRSLWHPAIVVVDEAHMYCPEKEEAESAGAVIDLMTRGRKRGFCGVLATQRISKLAKDAAAEANNKLIGRAALDVDMKRAGLELGFTSREQLLELRALEAGEFFAFGPALSPQVMKIKVGPVETTHPEAGKRAMLAPAEPTAKVRSTLAKLADLPKEAEQEAQDLAALRRQVVELKRQLSQASLVVGRPDAKARETIESLKASLKTARDAVKGDLARARQEAHAEGVREGLRQAARHIMPLVKDLGRLADSAIGLRALADALKDAKFVDKLGGNVEAFASLKLFNEALAKSGVVSTPNQSGSRTVVRPALPAPGNNRGADDVIPGIAKGERVILRAIAQHETGVTREQLTVLTGYKKSSRDTYLQRMMQRGECAISAETRRIVATEHGIDVLGTDYEPLPTGAELREYWRGRLSGGEKAIFEAVTAAWPSRIDKETISEATGYAKSSRDTYLQRLGARELIITDRAGVRAARELFDD